MVFQTLIFLKFTFKIKLFKSITKFYIKKGALGKIILYLVSQCTEFSFFLAKIKWLHSILDLLSGSSFALFIRFPCNCAINLARQFTCMSQEHRADLNRDITAYDFGC